MVLPCCGSASFAFMAYTKDIPKKRFQLSLKSSAMEPVIQPFYRDLGLNPIGTTTRKGLNILYAIVIIFAIVKWVVGFSANEVLPSWPLIILVASFVFSLYFVNRTRFYPEGLFFVSITQDHLKYRGLKDSEAQFFTLNNIEYIHHDEERVGFKPAGDHWHYISSSQYTKEVFEHLQKAIANHRVHSNS